MLEEVFQLKKSKSKKKDEEQARQTESFEIIDTTSNKKKDNVQTTKELFEMNEDFEHLSQYDPDDEFLRSNKSVSIIDSILSKKAIS